MFSSSQSTPPIVNATKQLCWKFEQQQDPDGALHDVCVTAIDDHTTLDT